MSFESYKTRMKSTGKNPVDYSKNNTKQSNVQMIMNSPTRRSIKINNDVTEHDCLVTDINSYELREFLMLPDTVIHKGDYLHYENFTYLVTKPTANEDFPKVTAQLCNFEFPIAETIEEVITGYTATGRPLYETVAKYITKPSVMTAKIYSTLDNSSVPLPDGAMSILLPYSDILPEQNKTITVHHSQYKIVDLIYQNTLVIEDITRGYVEIRLQRESNTNG